MPYLEVINGDNQLLIDDEYSNLTLARKLQATVVKYVDAAAGYINISYVQNLDSVPLVAAISSYAYSLKSFKKVGDTYTWQFVFEPGSIGSSVTFFIFTVPEVLPNSKGLFQCYNAQSKLIFDSGSKAMRAVGFSRYTTPAWSDVAVPITKVIAIAVLAPVFINEYFRIGTSYTWNIEYEGFYVAGGAIRRRLFTAFSGGGPSGAQDSVVYRNDNGALMAIDVTGF